MRVKTAELLGDALDWAVGYARCLEATSGKPVLARDLMDAAVRNGMARPSTDWAQGGPIIEQMMQDGLVLQNDPDAASEVAFVASMPYPNRFQFGSTVLIAAMRSFVASRLGEEVDVPDELVA